MVLAGKNIILQPAYAKYLHREPGTELSGLRVRRDSWTWPLWTSRCSQPMRGSPGCPSPERHLQPRASAHAAPGAKLVSPFSVVMENHRSYALQQPFPYWKAVTMPVSSSLNKANSSHFCPPRSRFFSPLVISAFPHSPPCGGHIRIAVQCPRNQTASCSDGFICRESPGVTNSLSQLR